MMLITVLLMIEDRCSISFAKKLFVMYIICDENGWKTNSVFYFKIEESQAEAQNTPRTEHALLLALVVFFLPC